MFGNKKERKRWLDSAIDAYCDAGRILNEYELGEWALDWWSDNGFEWQESDEHDVIELADDFAERAERINQDEREMRATFAELSRPSRFI